MINNQHTNFYLIELKNQGLLSIFSKDYNLRFFLTASTEFSNDIEVINETKKVIDNVKKTLSPGTITIEKFNPNYFPTLKDPLLMDLGPDGQVLDIHPNVAKVTLVTLNDQSVIQARSVGIPNYSANTGVNIQ